MLLSDWTICYCQTECRQRCSCQLVTQWLYTKRIVLIDVDIVSGKKQIDSDLTWSVFISTTIFVITVVKICCRLMRNSNKLFLLIRVQTTLDHCWFVNEIIYWSPNSNIAEFIDLFALLVCVLVGPWKVDERTGEFGETWSPAKARSCGSDPCKCSWSNIMILL